MPNTEYISHSQLLLQYLFAIEVLTSEKGAAELLPETAAGNGLAGDPKCLP
jgi:hypothetical protein